LDAESFDERDGIEGHSPPLLACHRVYVGFHHLHKTLVKEEKNRVVLLWTLI